MINEDKKSRGQEVKQISSLHTLAPCGRAKLRTDGVERVRMASRLSLLLRSNFGETLRAWSNLKTGQGEGLCGLPRSLRSLAMTNKKQAPIPTFPHKGRSNTSSLVRSKGNRRNEVSLVTLLPEVKRSGEDRGGCQSNKVAFTLAEVLITLGIIGIVAAMTLPALIQHHRKVEYSSRVKKFYSSMSQAILLSQAQNGSPSEWDINRTIYDEEGVYDYNANGEFTNNFFMKYLAPYIKYTKIEQGKTEIDEDGNQMASSTTVYFADGSTAWLWNGACIDMGFDVNGKSKPNQSGRDNFRFLICPSATESLGHCGSTQKRFCNYHGWPYTDNRNTLLNRCKTNASWCTGILMHDGWEFKKDYPYKL